MDGLPTFEGTIERALGKIAAHSPYAEAMAQSSRGTRLRLDKNQTNPTPLPLIQGVAFRAWSGRFWLDVSASGLEAKEVDQSASQLVELLSKHTGCAPVPGTQPSGHGERHTELRRPGEDVPLTEQVAWAVHARDTASAVTGISNTIVNLGTEREERLFLSSSGARYHQRVDRAQAAVIPLAMENGRVEFDLLLHGETGGWETLSRVTDERIRQAARTSSALLKAGTPPSGAMTVVLDPSTAGTFAHESFGHGTEADQFLRDRSYLKAHLGERVGPECLTLVDDGTVPGAWGSFFFDDEGTPTQRTVMVDHGEFVEVLHDRETAAAMHRAPTGNARRADFLSREFVRMTNTLVHPGDRSLDELVEEARDGVLLEVCTSGMEDPLGGQMQLKVQRGRLIEHGKLGAMVGAMALSGKVLEFLQSVKAVGKREYFEISPGYCGKGHSDTLPAGTGGSYLLSHAIVGPT
ncbi:MAG: TldD/PmbA family protein [Thermoplasmata archaeon]|nr:TldD/PmbA family protein [Thermoplasmata archaeon]